MRKRYLDILEMHKDKDQQKRLAQGQKIDSVYCGDHESYLKNIGFDLFKINVFRKIIDKKIGILYQTQPTRSLKNPGDDAILKVNLECELNGLMRDIMRSVELFGSVWVDWKNKSIFTPMQVFERDGKKMVLKDSSDAKNKFQWVYDNTQVYEFEDKVEKRMLKSSDLIEYKKEEHDYKKTIELVDMQIELTRIATFLKVATVLQCVDQVFTDDNALTTINMSPEVINFIARDSKIHVVHFKADLVSIRATYLEIKSALYEMSGVPEVSVVGDVASRSAKELIAKWYPLVETYRGLAQEYEVLEKKVVVDIFSNIYNTVINESDYEIIFDKDFLPKEKRTPEGAEFELKNNIITVKSLLKEENPVLSDAEIDILLEKNIETNKKYKPVLKNGENSNE